ncbi:MAG: hypothetical protein RIS45_1178 [Planctomycetota bacterium]
MRWLETHTDEAAIDYLLRRAGAAAWRPDGLLDRSLLTYPDAFGAELAQPLSEARELVLREGDAPSRDILCAAASAVANDREIQRMRRLLAKRPTAIEQASPALVLVSERMVIAMPHAIPCSGRRISVRIQTPLHPEVGYASATRCEAGAELLAEWTALGYSAPPHAVWTCDPPSWCIGGPDLPLAVELAPNPSGFNEAMLIAHDGAARVLALQQAIGSTNAASAWRIGTVMPSGWSYLRGDRTMGSSLPTMPNGAPYPATHVRVPDDDLFAVCAARSWTGSLRDSVWLRRRNDFRLLAGGSTTTHGMNGETR